MRFESKRRLSFMFMDIAKAGIVLHFQKRENWGKVRNYSSRELDMEIIKLGIYMCVAAFISLNSWHVHFDFPSFSYLRYEIYIQNCLQISVICGPMKWYFIGRCKKNVWYPSSRDETLYDNTMFGITCVVFSSLEIFPWRNDLFNVSILACFSYIYICIYVRL